MTRWQCYKTKRKARTVSSCSEPCTDLYDRPIFTLTSVLILSSTEDGGILSIQPTSSEIPLKPNN